MALVVQLRTRLSDAHTKELATNRCTQLDASVLLQGDADVYKPDGEPLVMLRRKAIPESIIEGAYPALHYLKKYTTDNRGKYTGVVKRAAGKFKDGTMMRNTRTRDERGKIIQTESAIIGFIDRQGGRHPYCRTTRFTATEVEKWESILPMVHHVDELFRNTLPERYRVQREAADKSHPSWVINGTAFSTLTVNNNVVAGVHTDKGDFKAGFGIISCVRRGQYSGAALCFPQYRVGVNLGDGDVLFFNAHDWHGMTPLVPESDDHERITCVYYFREKMLKCGSPDEELAHAKKVRGKL